MKPTSFLKILSLSFLGACLFAALGPSVHAQPLSKCSVPQEAILTLPPSRLGMPAVWDASYAPDDQVIQFFDGIALEEGTVMAYGRVLDEATLAPKEIILREINRRGRVMSAQSWAAKEAERPVVLIRINERFLTASTISKPSAEKKAVNLIWRSKTGEALKEIQIEDTVYDLRAQSLISATGQGDKSSEAEESGSFILVAQASEQGGDQKRHAVIGLFEADGKELWRRAYQPGIPNKINNVLSLPEGGYLAVGQIQLEDGRNAGWVMKLDNKGAVLWQKTFPRGKGAAFTHAAAYGDGARGKGRYVLFGQVSPLDGGPLASWIMDINNFGEIWWQRYLRREDASYRPVGLMREPDGRLSLAMNVKTIPESGQTPHVRLLTLAPEGAIIGDEAYLGGQEAQIQSFIRGWNGERIIVGSVLAGDKPLDFEMVGDRFVVIPPPEQENDVPEAEEEEDDPRLQGWILVAVPLDPYEDPCQ